MQTEKIKEIVSANLGYEVDPTLLDEVARAVINECTQLIEQHAHQLRKFNFVTNAQTAETCAGILKEHFNTKEEVS